MLTKNADFKVTLFDCVYLSSNTAFHYTQIEVRSSRLVDLNTAMGNDKSHTGRELHIGCTQWIEVDQLSLQDEKKQ